MCLIFFGVSKRSICFSSSYPEWEGVLWLKRIVQGFSWRVQGPSWIMCVSRTSYPAASDAPTSRSGIYLPSPSPGLRGVCEREFQSSQFVVAVAFIAIANSLVHPLPSPTLHSRRAHYDSGRHSGERGRAALRWPRYAYRESRASTALFDRRFAVCVFGASGGWGRQMKPFTLQSRRPHYRARGHSGDRVFLRRGA